MERPSNENWLTADIISATEARPSCDRCVRSGCRCQDIATFQMFIFRDENSRIVRRALKSHSRGAPGADDGAEVVPDVDEKSDVAAACRQVQGPRNKRIQVRGWRIAAAPKSPQRQEQPFLADLKSPAIQPMVPVRIGRSEAVCFFLQQFSWETVSIHAAKWKNLSPALTQCHLSAWLGDALVRPAFALTATGRLCRVW